jgi:hypothetical protein
MAPPGTRIIAHENPSRRRTWAPNGQDGWYIGPALEHYRCYTVYITKTRGDRIVETVDFSPDKFILPFSSSQDLATQAAADLTHALLHPQSAGPFCKVGDKQTIALKQRKSKIIVNPTDGIENTAPQRVHTTVFTSEGGRHKRTTNVSPAKHIITLNTKFTSQTKNTCQTCSHTTNTACHGETQC